MIKALEVFSGLTANDLSIAKAFYSNILGLELKDEQMGLKYSLPSGGSVFIYEKPDHSPAAFTVLNFVVEDIDSVVAQLVADGVSMERYENMPGDQDENGVMRGLKIGHGPDIAWFKDPFGNILSVIQPS